MERTNVLVTGNGMRESALVRTLARSYGIGNILVSPGNTGTHAFGRNIPEEDLQFSMPGIEAMGRRGFVQKENIGLVIIGPDAHVVEGMADQYLQAGCPVFGPERILAKIEGSKVFGREVAGSLDIPTPRWIACHSIEGVRHALRGFDPPFVLKADGLRQGKGVEILHEEQRAIVWAEKYFTETSEPLLVEEYLHGVEASKLALCDGETWILLPPVLDHKYALDGNAGGMTGGMGCVTPAPYISESDWKMLGRLAVEPILQWAKEKTSRGYRGCLFVNWMLTPGGQAKVLEFNARFGDPEIQTALAIIPTAYDRLMHFQWCAEGSLSAHGYAPGYVLRNGWHAATVVVVGERYPEAYEGFWFKRHIPEPPQGVGIYLGNVREEGNGMLFSDGGRVLSVTAAGETLEKAIASAYAYARSLNIPGTRFRTDIGANIPSWSFT